MKEDQLPSALSDLAAAEMQREEITGLQQENAALRAQVEELTRERDRMMAFLLLLEPDDADREEILADPNFWASDYRNAMDQLAAVMEYLERAEGAEAKLAKVVEALEEIVKGEGRFSRDLLEHASNTIEDMKALAVAALTAARGEKADE